MKKIFISQDILDNLFEEEKADLDGNQLTIHSRKDQVYNLNPAYKFVSLLEGEKDEMSLIGKIYTNEELEKIGCDAYMDSAIINDIVYTVEQGFVGYPEGAEEKKATEPAQSEDAAKEGSSKEEDDDMLADYLLKIL
jgi:hypothetical protein